MTDTVWLTETTVRSMVQRYFNEVLRFGDGKVTVQRIAPRGTGFDITITEKPKAASK